MHGPFIHYTIFPFTEDELPMPDDAGEILTCEPAQREKLRPKLLSFHENRRPPYWGTWRKKSASVGPRRPFGQDEVCIKHCSSLTHRSRFLITIEHIKYLRKKSAKTL